MIPTYNDAARLKPFLKSLRVLPQEFNVVICDDGSSLEDKEKLKALKVTELKEHSLWEGRLELMSREKNRGKGFTIREGWKAYDCTSVGTYGFVDADGAFMVEDIIQCEIVLRQCNAQALMGSRFKTGNKIVKRGMIRSFGGKFIRNLIKKIQKLSVEDSQCGIKFLKKEAYQKLYPYLQTERFALDVEIIALLEHFNISYIEVPINCKDVPNSTIRPLRDSFLLLWDTYMIRKKIDKLQE